MSLMIHDVRIAKHTPTSYKYNISPKYIREGKLSVAKRYNVWCYGGLEAVHLNNRRILVSGSKEYPEYRITVPKSLVDFKILKLGIEYTLELFEIG